MSVRSETAARAFFVALFVLTLYLVYLIFKPFLAGIAWAVVLAVAFLPLYERMVRWFRGRAWLAATVLSLLVGAGIVVPCALAVVKIGKGLVDGYHRLESYWGETGSAGAMLDRVPWAKDAVEWAGQYVDLEAIDLQKIALSAAKTVANAAAGKSGAFVADAVSTILTVIVLLLTMATLFHEGPKLVQLVRRYLPLSEADRDAALTELRDVTRSVFLGGLLTAFAQGILGAIGWGLAGLAEPVTFGAAMFFCALLPAGTAIIWGPGALWLVVSGHPWAALFLTLWGALVVSMADNLIRPLLIGRGVKMHSLLVFFSIFGGILAFGLIGLFIGPLIITFFLFLLEVLKRDLFRDSAAEEGSKA